MRVACCWIFEVAKGILAQIMMSGGFDGRLSCLLGELRAVGVCWVLLACRFFGARSCLYLLYSDVHVYLKWFAYC
jgi:hypothetical protein